MFGLTIVKTAELQALQNTVAVLESDVVALNRKYHNLADQVQRNNKAVRKQLSALAKPKTCPVLQQLPKYVTDPVAAWESKRLVLTERLDTVTKDLRYAERMVERWRGLHLNVCLDWQRRHDALSRSVQQLKEDIYEHSTRKPIVIQLPPPSETAVFVQHKKYGTLGLLKGNHITILSKGNQLNVGDVILNATPAVVHEFWDILPSLERVTFNV